MRDIDSMYLVLSQSHSFYSRFLFFSLIYAPFFLIFSHSFSFISHSLSFVFIVFNKNELDSRQSLHILQFLKLFSRFRRKKSFFRQ
jgi:hypothetical protein